MKILNAYQGKMFYILMLIQKVINIVIRDNQDDLAKPFDKGTHLPVNNRHCLAALLSVRLWRRTDGMSTPGSSKWRKHRLQGMGT